jgi:bifunctional lysine-specific demethylase and histidyl-hydroxylase MINA
MTMTLADLLAPVSEAAFFAEYHDRAPLHVRGGAAKFAEVLSWRQINRLLDQTHVWSSHSLKLVREGVPVPPEQYCLRATSRDNAPVMQPDAALVAQWVARGASVVMNDVDSLTPGLASVSAALEGAGLGKAQGNVYISWRSHKAFNAHFDTHDVWAVQVEGEKIWNVWQGRAPWPIAHQSFKSLGQEHHEKAKGALRERVLMKPGDLLYLPRGWYHDALAEAESSVHIAYGVHAPLGMDLMSMLSDRVVYDEEFRRPLPRQDGSAAAQEALRARAAALGQRLAEFSRDPKVLEVLARFVADYRFRRGGNDLLAARGLTAPAAPEEPGSFRVVDSEARPVRRGGEWALRTARGALPLSPSEAEATGWILARADVAEGALRAAHPQVDAAGLLARLREAGVLVPAA